MIGRRYHSDFEPTSEEKKQINEAARASVFPKVEERSRRGVNAVNAEPEALEKPKRNPTKPSSGGVRSIEEIRQEHEETRLRISELQRSTDAGAVAEIGKLRHALIRLDDEMQIARNVQAAEVQRKRQEEAAKRQAEFQALRERRVEVMRELIPHLGTVEPLVEELWGINYKLGDMPLIHGFSASEFTGLCENMRKQGKKLLGNDKVGGAK